VRILAENYGVMSRTVFLLLFVLIASTGTAQRYVAAELVLNDGTVKTGFAQSVLETNKKIRFKTTEKGANESISHTDLKRAAYFFTKDTSVFERLSYYTTIKSNKLLHNGWFELIQRGYVSIYLVRASLGGGTTMNASGSMQSSAPAKFKDYYAFKEGEPGGRQVSSVASLNSNAVFKKFAPIYFSDYPELAEKIKMKKYTYEDLLEVTNVYNAWYAAKKQ